MSLSKKDGGLPPDTVVQSEEKILADSERVIKEFPRRKSPGHAEDRPGAVQPFFRLRTVHERHRRALARQYGVLLHTHLAETKDENAYCERTLKRRPLKVMEDCDFLGPDVWFAHGIHFNDDELAVLKETGCSIAHCPTSNMRLGSGICRVKEMQAVGINVALAVGRQRFK